MTLVGESVSCLADLRLRGRSGTGGWDVVSIGSGGAARAGAENILQPLDYGAIDVSTFFPGYHSKYWVAGDLYSTAITWNTNKYKSEAPQRSEEHTSELQSLMRISYAVFCLKKKKRKSNINRHNIYIKL